MHDTIFALATPVGRSGVAIIRVSGSQAWVSAKTLINKDLLPRQAMLCTLKNPASSEIIDKALVLGFKAPASYTGEDIIEFHLHGGQAVIQALISFLAKQKQHRMAEPGEFTRRAFENGKMDLTEAEAVADLINAETQNQKAQALMQMSGALSTLYESWTKELKSALAYLEADIEFPDEDMPENISPQILHVLEKLIIKINEHLNDNRRGERLRDGLHVAVIGAPNAGKSSLVNALAQRDIAIVSSIKGTTRDIIEAHLDLGGLPVILADTAGLRPNQIGKDEQSSIESEGIKRALECAEKADIKLLLFDGTKTHPDIHTKNLIDDNSLVVINKSDKDISDFNLPNAFIISTETGNGLDILIQALIEKAHDLIGIQESPSLTRQRHRIALEECIIALKRAVNVKLPELVAEDTRLAIRSLGRITGCVDVEDLLDIIFQDFCIGK
ncbi:MAG: tRNA uridine-5-carboxymethylaminomethyl(34) synthesis GTPase MnmE [Alphaproteobacteria bacterium]|nr:tRNA uridine-5-carboxymethylaminomethyl(34) synthesis GTPase MnmE [Alphaproteobacteria bacterium]